MLSFRNDYSEGAHPQVFSALAATNLEQTSGYGTDPYCEKAADTIRNLCHAPNADVHFLVGGTQVNKTFIGAVLRPWEAVLSAHTGHICVHETGAIEQDGHKIIHLPSDNGKVTVEALSAALAAHASEHMVLPRLVYLSNTTEVGTVYTKAELTAISSFCRSHDLLLYCDGARLGSAMTIEGADLTLPDYAALCDSFTVGGTKNGLLFGEALIIANPALCPQFRFHMKQQGAILAKGRLLGLQFSAILENNVYWEIAAHANAMAKKLRDGLASLGVSFAIDSPSNQLFPILTRQQAASLEKVCAFEVQHPVGENSLCIRFVTSWATKEEDVAALLACLREVLA